MRREGVRRGALILLAVILVGLVVILLVRHAETAPPVVVTADPAQSLSTTALTVGVTHTQHSADLAGNPKALQAALDVLRATATLQNQHIMGWGALNPEPSPGDYRWESLDARMALIRRSGGTPVITLCCAPDWMKGGAEGTTDWDALETAPVPAHYGDFAQLAAQVARRYPDVRYFQVWNELKGFYDPARNNWNIEAYTALYNQVYTAVKAARPDAMIGGPYVVIDSWAPSENPDHESRVAGAWGVADQRSLDVLDYWLAHKQGADFVIVDGTTATKNDALTTDQFAATEKFAAVDEWLRQRTGLPVWWAEWYVQPSKASWSPQDQNATMTVGLIHMARSGASVALLWGPQGSNQTCRGCLWSDTSQAGDGRPTPFAASMRSWIAAFPPGTRLVRTTSTSPAVWTLASADTLLLVNTAPCRVTVAAYGHRVRLAAREVRYLPLR
jgi:Glycosyl hydrolases family 39